MTQEEKVLLVTLLRKSAITISPTYLLDTLELYKTDDSLVLYRKINSFAGNTIDENWLLTAKLLPFFEEEVLLYTASLIEEGLL